MASNRQVTWEDSGMKNLLPLSHECWVLAAKMGLSACTEKVELLPPALAPCHVSRKYSRTLRLLYLGILFGGNEDRETFVWRLTVKIAILFVIDL